MSPFDHCRVIDFDQRLQDVDKEIQAFKKKEVMNLEAMKQNVGKLTQITANLEAALTELEVRDTAVLRKYACDFPFDLKAFMPKQNIDFSLF